MQKSNISEFPLENQRTYDARIRFRPYVIIPPDINTKIANSSREAENSADAQTTIGGDDILFSQPVLDARRKNPLVSKTREKRHPDEVRLYMPPQIQIVDGVNIQNLDLNAFGAGVERGIQTGSGPIEAIAEGTMNGINSFVDALRGNLDAEGARAFASRTSAMFSSDTTSGAIQSALRTTPNPNTRMIFRSVNIREFSFDFIMIPTSPAETEEIKKIVHTFRKHLYPKTIELEGTGIPIAYRFPNVFQIDMYYGDKNLGDINPSLKFQRMYLRNFSANYNPNSMGFHKNGDFNEVQISLTFTETKALTYEDIASEMEQTRDFIHENYPETFTGGR